MHAPQPWLDCDRQIVRRLDIPAAYADLGVPILDRPDPSAGWHPCRALGDAAPAAATAAAAVCVTTGRYRERGGGHRSLPLWAVAAKAGRFATWREARRHYADLAGVALPAGEEPLRPVEQFASLAAADGDAALAAWCRRAGGFDLRDAKAAGGRAARKAAATRAVAQGVVAAFPVYGGPEYLDGAPSGLLVSPVEGDGPSRWPDGDEAGRMRSYPADGSSPGLIGRDALARLRPPAPFPGDGVHRGGGLPRVELVWVVEGLRHLLALTYHLRCAGLADTHVAVAVASAGACPDALRPEWLDLLRGHAVRVACRQDEAGLERAERWAVQLGEAGCAARHVRLPLVFKRSPRLELADFLADATYEDLLEAAQ